MSPSSRPYNTTKDSSDDSPFCSADDDVYSLIRSSRAEREIHDSEGHFKEERVLIPPRICKNLKPHTRAQGGERHQSFLRDRETPSVALGLSNVLPSPVEPGLSENKIVEVGQETSGDYLLSLSGDSQGQADSGPLGRADSEIRLPDYEFETTTYPRTG